MHGIGAHSALAIKRQRRRREQNRKGKQPAHHSDHYEADNKVMGTITMFHVGAVFLLLACFLMLGAVLTSESRQETAELVGTGIICLVIGLFLVILNRFYGQKEEDDLANYVESRLGRSRSGQRLYHESESMPENLGEAGPSASVSMESDISRDMSKTKGNKRGKKKNKQSGIEVEPTAVNGGQGPKVMVDLANEHNQYRNSSATYHNDVSSASVTLDRIAEEQAIAGVTGIGIDHQHQQISYVNTSYDDGSSSRGASNNLYRVYDRDYARAGGAV
ncbi:unnamed protein product [Orchesella dallaii]|uniref:Uncharacterized protein n=1 Tax=Orchesella dallaii TaxID=48710 RepID=A0ABP1RA11_9HEXA